MQIELKGLWGPKLSRRIAELIHKTIGALALEYRALVHISSVESKNYHRIKQENIGTRSSGEKMNYVQFCVEGRTVDVDIMD